MKIKKKKGTTKKIHCPFAEIDEFRELLFITSNSNFNIIKISSHYPSHLTSPYHFLSHLKPENHLRSHPRHRPRPNPLLRLSFRIQSRSRSRCSLNGHSFLSAHVRVKKNSNQIYFLRKKLYTSGFRSRSPILF